MSDAEHQIIDHLRSLRPYERIEIIADQQGRPNYFIVHRSVKVVVNGK